MAKMLRTTAIVALLVIASCADDDTSAEPTTITTPPTTQPEAPSTGDADGGTTTTQHAPPAVEDAVRTYTRAFGAGDANTAWDIVSARCQADLSRTQYASAVADASRLYPDLDVTEITTRSDGDSAAVTYSTTAARSGIEYVSQPWILENGQWRWDAC